MNQFRAIQSPTKPQGPESADVWKSGKAETVGLI